MGSGISELGLLISEMGLWIPEVGLLISELGMSTLEPGSSISEPGLLITESFFSGWSNHFVSKRKYHMVIPVDTEWNKPLDDGVFDVQNHLLHGLIHSNGFGHLLCLNGIEGGSKYLHGREIMDLWDRICTNLQTRYKMIINFTIFIMF